MASGWPGPGFVPFGRGRSLRHGERAAPASTTSGRSLSSETSPRVSTQASSPSSVRFSGRLSTAPFPEPLLPRGIDAYAHGLFPDALPHERVRACAPRVNARPAPDPGKAPLRRLFPGTATRAGQGFELEADRVELEPCRLSGPSSLRAAALWWEDRSLRPSARVVSQARIHRAQTQAWVSKIRKEEGRLRPAADGLDGTLPVAETS